MMNTANKTASQMVADSRYVDLMRQGFMKPRKARRIAAPREVVACDACMNWHPKGKHTADAAARRFNLEKLEAKARAAKEWALAHEAKP